MADFWGRKVIEEASKYAIAVECSSCAAIFPAFVDHTSKKCGGCRNVEWAQRMGERIKSLEELVTIYEKRYIKLLRFTEVQI